MIRRFWTTTEPSAEVAPAPLSPVVSEGGGRGRPTYSLFDVLQAAETRLEPIEPPVLFAELIAIQGMLSVVDPVSKHETAIRFGIASARTPSGQDPRNLALRQFLDSFSLG